MKLITICLILLLFNILGPTFIHGQAASRKKMIEEMSQNMKEMETAFGKLSNQLKSTEANLNLFQDKLNVVLNTVEVTKVRTRMIEEKFTTLESKLATIEETAKTSLAHLINSSGATGVNNRLESTEKGLLKIMNVLTDLYGLVKENHLNDKPTLSRRGESDFESESNMRKIVREEVNILKHELANDMNITGLTGRLGEVFSIITNIQENSVNNKKPGVEDDSNGNQLTSQPRDEVCSDFSRLRNQFSFAVQELRNNMTLVMDTISKGKCNTLTSAGSPVSSSSAPSPSFFVTLPNVNQADSPRLDGLTQRINDCPIMDPRLSSKLDCTHSRPNFPKDCAEIITSNSTCQSKVYAVRTGSPLRVQRVYCDMDDNGGGWTVILRRGKFSEKKHHVDFRTNWQTYKRGFGDIGDEFWIGNEVIHHLTTKEPQILQIDMKSFSGECISVQFKKFIVASESDNYQLQIDEPFGSNKETAEIFLTFNGTSFITSDRIKDSQRFACLNLLTGGWWVNPSRCPLVYLTGLYKEVDVRREVDTGVRWMTFKENESLREVQMKIRPFSFLNKV
ncbi:angiopoietin-2 [Tetranychus urticae]|uniref:Fibrinogen C-terminal domain-containing protein n=1 Tax=Tetranychus urticae TaxID=32264 RepID=T1KNJ9_TETUR|nr:angiopoietin-2 [Tetranychus urticae]